MQVNKFYAAVTKLVNKESWEVNTCGRDSSQVDICVQTLNNTIFTVGQVKNAVKQSRELFHSPSIDMQQKFKFLRIILGGTVNLPPHAESAIFH